MIIHCKNGEQVETNPYIGEKMSSGARTILIGDKQVEEHELPVVGIEDWTLRYLTFANLLYVIAEDFSSQITRYYIIEQELVKGQVRIKDIYTSVEVEKTNDLEQFFRYNKEFERRNLIEVLVNKLSDSMYYVINSDELKRQMIDKLDNKEEEPKIVPENAVKPIKINTKVSVEGKTLADLSKETKIPYNTLWNRTHRLGLTVEQAVALGKGKRGGFKNKK